MLLVIHFYARVKKMMLLKSLVLPPASLFLLYVIAATIKHRASRTARVLAATAVLLLFSLSTQWGSLLLVRPLEEKTSPLQHHRAHGAKAIVVLAAGRVQQAPEYDGRDIPDYIALPRLRYAAWLHRRTGLPLLVSGGIPSPSGGEPLAIPMARVLRDEFNVPVTWIEQSSRNTTENAIHSASMLSRNGIGHVLLVTDAMHMHRARLAFSTTSLHVTEAPTLFLGRVAVHPYGFIPTAEALRRSCYAIYQWLGIFFVKMETAYGSL